MEEGFDRRLYLPDVRGADRYLRVTWHSSSSTIVLSHWRGDLCAASTPITLEDATRLIGLIVGALQERASLHHTLPRPEPRAGTLVSRLRDRFRPQLAEIVRLKQRVRSPGPTRQDGNA